jgi:hypothetical protein
MLKNSGRSCSVVSLGRLVFLNTEKSRFHQEGPKKVFAAKVAGRRLHRANAGGADSARRCRIAVCRAVRSGFKWHPATIRAGQGKHPF